MLETIKSNTKQSLDSLRAVDLNDFIEKSSRFQPWNEIQATDIREFIEKNIELLEQLFEAGGESLFLSVNALNNLKSNIDAVVQRFSDFLNVPDQAKLNRLASQIEGLKNTMLSSGIYSLALFYPNIEILQQRYLDKIDQVEQGKKRIDQLENNLKQLAGKAVSGSLSKAFSSQENWMFSYRIFWLVNIVASVLLLGWYARESIDGSDDPTGIGYWIKRFVIAAPGIYYLWFSMSQYKKERSLEQEYGHRRAVAMSIPAYKDQVVDEKSKDNISVSAANVIFGPPPSGDKEVGLDKLLSRFSDLAAMVSNIKK